MFLLERRVLSPLGLSGHYSPCEGNDMNCPTPTLQELYKGLTVLMALVVLPMLPGDTFLKCNNLMKQFVVFLPVSCFS